MYAVLSVFKDFLHFKLKIYKDPSLFKAVLKTGLNIL